MSQVVRTFITIVMNPNDDSIPIIISWRIIIMREAVITMLKRIILSIIFVFIFLFRNICIIGGRRVLVFRQGEKLWIRDVVLLVSKLVLLATIGIHFGPWQFDAKLLELRRKKLQVCTNLHVGLGSSKHT